MGGSQGNQKENEYNFASKKKEMLHFVAGTREEDTNLDRQPSNLKSEPRRKLVVSYSSSFIAFLIFYAVINTDNCMFLTGNV